MSDTKITETYEFNTNILTSYSGREQRIKTRQYPRHMFSYDYDGMDIYQAQYIRALLRRKQNQTQYIPYWPNVTRLVEDIVGGWMVRIPKESLFNFYNCYSRELFAQDDVTSKDANVVRKVRGYRIDNATDTAVIELTTPLHAKYKAKATFVFPLIKTVTQPSSEAQYMFARGTHTTLNFECVDTVSKTKLPPSVLPINYDIKEFHYFDIPKEFNDRPVFLFTPSWVEDESVQLKIDKNVTKLDNKTGVFQYDVKSNKCYDTNIWDINLLNKEMIYNMIKFFISVGGMYKAFYLPTWVNDVETYDGFLAGRNFICTELSAMAEYYSSITRNKYIIVLTKDFKSYIFKIMGYAKDTIAFNDGSKKLMGKILLSETIGTQIPLDNLLMVSYLNLVRLDSDELKLDYESDCVATTTLSFKEVDV